MEHRKALLRNMVTSLILEERIETTLPRAKELRRVAERMVTLGKRGTLHARRQALSYVRTNEAVQKLFSELAVRFNERNGGYTRILKLGTSRRGDAAPMAIIEYLGAPMKPSKEERKRLKTEARRQQEEEMKKARSKKKAKPKKVKAKAEEKKIEEKVEEKPTKKTPIKKAPVKEAASKGAVFKETADKKTKKKGVFGRVLGRKSKKTDTK
jgi:large subunit ribosomal protein L17